MKAFNWRSPTMWTTVSLLFLLLALMVGPTPALAGGVCPGSCAAGLRSIVATIDCGLPLTVS